MSAEERALASTAGATDATMNPDDEGRRPIRRALISVYDKTGLEELVRALGAAGVEIVSTGKTADLVASFGPPVARVEALTGFPECLDGRVKTLHPAVHAGLLADLRLDRHRAELAELGIAPFDLLVSNLYPFQDTVASGADQDACVEQIDIGGPAMVRAAAKNHQSVAVVTSPSAYPAVIAALAEGGLTLAQRRRFAARAFADIAAYDVAVAEWCAQELAPDEQWWPDVCGPGTGTVRGPAVRREPAPARRALRRPGRAARPGPGAAARRQGDVLQQLRRRGRGLAHGARLRRAGSGDYQARQPVWHRHRAGCGGGAPAGPRVRSGFGVRRRHRHEPTGQRGAGPAGGRHLHRGDRGTLLCGGCSGHPCDQEEPAHPRRSSVDTCDGRVPPGLRRHAGTDGGPDRCRGRRPACNGSWRLAAPYLQMSWPISLSPGGRYGRSSPTPSCSPAAVPPSVSAWAR